MSSNPYEPETAGEKKSRAEQMNRIRQANDTVMKAARSCINTKQFQHYKGKYKIAESLLVDQIINFKEKDPLLYAFEIATMTSNLRALRMLLQEVYRDARTKYDEDTERGVSGDTGQADNA